MFIMIFGYFGIRQKFNLKRLINLIITVLTYSVLTCLVITIISRQYELKTLIKAIIPISLHKYWFISAYAVFYLFTPLLNDILTKLNKKEYQIFLLIMLTLWSFIPTITLNKLTYYCNELEQFLLIYSIGAYMRLHCEDSIKSLYVKILSGLGKSDLVM